MSSPSTSDTGTRPAIDADAVPPPLPCSPSDSWLRIGAQVFLRFPLPGQPGHGRTAFVRRRPVRIVDGRMEGGYTDAYELICPSCGDNPYLDFGDVPAQLQLLRGSYVLTAAVAAYEEHLGLSSCSDENSPSGPGPRDAKNGAPTEAANGDSPSDSVSASTTL
jgi:hypothetical protein